MAKLLAFLTDVEPLTATEVAWQCRLDDDVAEAQSDYISSVVIPSSRQLAETRSGSAIRSGRFVERFRQQHSLDRVVRHTQPRQLNMLLGTATVIESVEVGGVVLDPTDYELQPGDPEAQLVGHRRLPNAGDIVVIYQAGIDISMFPSVKQWMLLAAGWIYEQPEMYTVAAAVTALPAEYIDGLLAPIKCLPRF